MDLILAVDEAWGIGKDNGLPWPKLPADLKHFKAVSATAPEGKRNAVLMGRRTWESKEVGGRPLPRRTNVVLTRRPLAAPEGVLVVRAPEADAGVPEAPGAILDRALDRVAELPELGEVFVIGGAEIYRLALVHPRCRAIYLTRLRGAFGCDTFVPDLDALSDLDPSWPAADHVEAGVGYRIEKRLLRRPRGT
jgi:dihydrofolate reductase